MHECSHEIILWLYKFWGVGIKLSRVVIHYYVHAQNCRPNSGCYIIVNKQPTSFRRPTLHSPLLYIEGDIDRANMTESGNTTESEK